MALSRSKVFFHPGETGTGALKIKAMRLKYIKSIMGSNKYFNKSY